MKWKRGATRALRAYGEIFGKEAEESIKRIVEQGFGACDVEPEDIHSAIRGVVARIEESYWEQKIKLGFIWGNGKNKRIRARRGVVIRTSIPWSGCAVNELVRLGRLPCSDDLLRQLVGEIECNAASRSETETKVMAGDVGAMQFRAGYRY